MECGFVQKELIRHNQRLVFLDFGTVTKVIAHFTVFKTNTHKKMPSRVKAHI